MANVAKHFLLLVIGKNKLECLSMASFFRPIFVGKIGVYHYRPFVEVVCWPETNALAYFLPSSGTKKKVLRHGQQVINFFSVILEFS